MSCTTGATDERAFQSNMEGREGSQRPVPNRINANNRLRIWGDYSYTFEFKT